MICPIVLAAGRSTRMRTQKLLLPFGGGPVIARIVDELLSCSLGHIFVVVGRDNSKLRQALVGRRIELVVNPDPASDMLASIRCGLRVLPEDCSAFLIVLGDQPGLTAQLVNRLINEMAKSKERLVVPICGGHRGHPVLISSRFRDELLREHDGISLRDFLNSHTGETNLVEVESASTLADMDTPEDYQSHLNLTGE